MKKPPGIIISSQLEGVAYVARATGKLNLVVGGLFFVLAAFLLVVDAENGSIRPGGVLACAVLGISFILPGTLLWYFGSKLDNGAHWAYFPIVIVTILSLAEAAVLMLVPCTLVLRFPTLILVGCCINGISPIRDHYRAKKRKRAKRGFEPIMQSPMATVKPPPPPKRGGSRQPQ